MASLGLVPPRPCGPSFAWNYTVHLYSKAGKMRATPCLYKGFFGRSVEEFKRISNVVLNMEGIKGAQGPFQLHSFRTPEDVSECKVMSDVDIGGFSTASLDWIPSETTDSPTSAQSTPNANGYLRFHGSISTKLPQDKPDVLRTGYAAFRTSDRGPTVFGRSLWNIDPYQYLAMRVKSDGRSYLVNVQTESVVPSDLHQHRLFAKRPGEWETVLIRWNDFVRTNHGFVTEPQTEILRSKVRTVGFGLTDRVPGPFKLCIESIWATNDASEAGGPADESAPKAGELKNKHGEMITWS